MVVAFENVDGRNFSLPFAGSLFLAGNPDENSFFLVLPTSLNISKVSFWAFWALELVFGIGDQAVLYYLSITVGYRYLMCL